MQQALVQRRSTRLSTSVSMRRPSAGPNGTAKIPPAYGIDFLDRQQRAAAAEPGGSEAIVQRQEEWDEGEFLQGKFDSRLRTGAVDEGQQMQLEAPADPSTQFQAEPTPPQNYTGLPDRLKDGIESLSGMTMDEVRVHYNSSKPAQLQALAYTQGTEIHVAPGREQYLPHEAWHVVQQAQGRVKPTMQMKDRLLVNDDAGLEHEADVMGARAVASGGSAAGEVMTQHVGEGVHSEKTSLRFLSSYGKAQGLIQRVGIKTMGGEWDAEKYDLISTDPGGRRGIDIKLVFKPNASVDAKKIGLTQNVKSYKDSKPYVINNDITIKNRMIPEDQQWIDHLGEPTGGYKHDRISSKNNPLYGGNDLGVGKEPKDTVTAGNAHLGWRYKEGINEKIENPWLTDGPKMNNAATNSGAVFETTALALEGNQKDTFYGSIKWGWRSDNAGSQTKIPLEVISFGAPSPTFIKTAELWKNNPTSTGGATKGLPTENLIPVYFELKYASKPGEELYVTGNKAELGNWKPEGATRLRYVDAQTWQGMVTLNADKAQQNIEYKYLVKKGDKVTRWEEGSNHRPGKLPEGGKTVSYTNLWDDGK